ncbi:MAG: Gfo/Idh/MocA family oxidoreductase, partial [Bacteroidetes bacterium]|nr:Gfo/Idh/MocA family oxidoreductase [Bacteroidota bacterium]
ADAFAYEFNIPRSYGSYEALLADPDIDAVYIPLPQHLHCEFAIKAAQAGKHVLVEKPAALTAAEIEFMIAACRQNGVFFMEAFMYRFKSIQRRVKEIIASGQIGGITYIDFNWCFNIRNLVRSAFRMDRAKGGGAMYDLGIYGIDFIRFITGLEPEFIHATIRRESRDGVDMFAHVQYLIGDAVATVTAAFNTDANHYAIGGEKGSVLARAPLSGRAVENTLQIHMLDVDTLVEEKFPPENPFVAELEYFAQCIERNEQPFPDGENSLRNLRLMEEVFAKGSELTVG